jgi:hypothetical protein
LFRKIGRPLFAAFFVFLFLICVCFAIIICWKTLPFLTVGNDTLSLFSCWSIVGL